ncbi:SWIM zinc finger family protein [Paenibacillus daejeonensis]|uniref:SWIM zinc finger family protein n=1 Tax=Paenibacillus daejeonensis TaxID=135193 RepID=UPI0003800E3D|nr:SWIM zinc finger family protein [Paenibacillus daejeonensis]
MSIRTYLDNVYGKIYARGEDIWHSDQVLSCQLIEPGFYAAEVEGTDLYGVTIELSPDQHVLLTDCTCPYDMGPECKHIVAVLLLLEDQLNNAEANTASNEQASLAQLLQYQTKEKLMEILLSLAKDTPEVRTRLRFHLSHHDNQFDLEAGRKVIHTAIRQAGGYNGYIEWSQIGKALKGLWQVLDQANKLAKQQALQGAVQLYFLCAEEAVALLDDVDDDEGNVYMVGSEAIDNVLSITEDLQGESATNAAIKDIRLLIANEVKKPMYMEYSDWQLDLLNGLAGLLRTYADQADFEALLDEIERKQGSRPTIIPSELHSD